MEDISKVRSLELLWIAIGLALTTATQYRLAGPIGLGELMLALWALRAVWLWLHNPQEFESSNVSQVFGGFGIVAFLCLTLGLALSSRMGRTSQGFDHDLQSFCFAAILLWPFSCRKLSGLQLTQWTYYFLLATLLPLSFLAVFSSFIPGINAWYGEARFIGWSRNPNQLALALTILPFLVSFLWPYTRTRQQKMMTLVLSLITVGLGILTLSDALIVGWILGIGVFIFYNIFLRPQSYHPRSSSQSGNQITLNKQAIHTPLLKGLLVLSLMSIAVIFYNQIGEDFIELYNTFNSQGGQGEDRILLWYSGLAAGIRSPWFGLGPGAFSGIQPFSEFESHNTFVDWFASSGGIGLSAYIFLLLWIGFQAWQARSGMLLGALCSLIGFTLFHFVFRQTLFWFYLVLLARLSRARCSGGLLCVELQDSGLSKHK